MQAPSLATLLTRFSLISAIFWAGSSPVSAQPVNSAYYNNLPPGAVQPPMYQQPAPFMPQPYQPQPQSYQYQQQRPYTPPTLGATSAKKTATPAKKTATPTKAPAAKSKTSSTTASKPKPKSSKTSGSTTLESKVSRLEQNDRRQDLRLNHLERDVGLLPDTIEGGIFRADDESSPFYTAKPGDTVSEVARHFGVSASALRAANGLTGDELRLGQQIRIVSGSVSSSSGAVHRVRDGETFTQIARDYGVSQYALARANPSVYPDRLLVNERLIIPGGGSRYITTGDTGGSSGKTSSKSAIHVVKKGEHPGSIAKKYGISTSALVSANKLKNANIIFIGQRLVIPGVKSAPSISNHLVADSDTTPITERLIRDEMEPEKPVPPTEPAPALPPLTSTLTNTITEKAAPSPRGVVAYRMERGDTLETVANMFSTTQENIRALNKLPANKTVKEGDEIIVPSLGAVSLN